MKVRQAVLFALVVGVLLGVPSAAQAQFEHYLTSISLHAVVGSNSTCSDMEHVNCCYEPPDYQSPNASVPPATEITVYVILTEVLCYDGLGLRGVQTAFEWDPSWTFIGSDWNCQANQLFATAPHAPGGPREGTIATVFDCASGPHSFVIGKLHFITGATGCLQQVTPDFPFGIHFLDCDGVPHGISLPHDYFRIGSVCVGGGSNACWDPGPVEYTTWGKIKAQYGP